MSFSKGGIKAFKRVMEDYSRKSGKDQSVSKQQIDVEIEKNNQRIQNAQQLMLDGQLEPSDYKEIKNRFEKLSQNSIRRKGI